MLVPVTTTSRRLLAIGYSYIQKRSLAHMTQKKTAPYGRWASPISVDLLTGSTISIDYFKVHKDNKLYLTESRPFEGGRSVLLSLDDSGSATDVVSKEVDVRTQVHEYGGQAFALNKIGASNDLVYSNSKDSRVYRIPDLERSSIVEPITEVAKHLRFAEFAFHPTKSLIVAVCEDHSIDEPSRVQNYLVVINTENKIRKTIVSGSDFYASPTFSPDGQSLIWKEWVHPNMPWTTSKLIAAKFDATEVSVSDQREIVPKDANEPFAVTQPRFAPDGTLIFCSDVSGYQQLYKSVSPYTTVNDLTSRVQGDFADNDWKFGNATYVILSDRSQVIATYHSPLGMPLLARISISDGHLQSIKHPFLTIDAIDASVNNADDLYISGSTKEAKGLFAFNAQTDKSKVVKSVTSGTSVSSDFLSLATAIEIPLASGQKTFAFYYPPTSPDHQGPTGALPPLILRIHGGPTSFAPPVTSLQISYWTSRGYAFCMLNYAGSSGYGKSFMTALDDNWGVLDVRDAVQAASWLGDNKYCDKSKMAIDGGSAGGYTVLSVLWQSTVFAAGCSLYGISDLARLAYDTHKFESQYLFKLVGGTPEEKPEIYHDRSPLNFAKDIKSPVMIQQGTEDRVVPLNQAEKMVKEVQSVGGIVEFLVFKGEGHGFKGEKAQRQSLESETQFFEKYLKL